MLLQWLQVTYFPTSMPWPAFQAHFTELNQHLTGNGNHKEIYNHSAIYDEDESNNVMTSIRAGVIYTPADEWACL